MSGNEKVKRKSGVGAFIGGTFFGIILGIGALVGICVFAYFNVSIDWVNRTFNTSIDAGNDDINNLTLNVAISHAINLAQNTDTYTLDDLKSDFGIEIPDTLMGIDISSLKFVPLTEIANEAQSLIANISADELKNTIDLSGMQNILTKTKTYYYNTADNTLYPNADFSGEALDPDLYTLNSGIITLKGREYPLVQNGDNLTISVELNYLPLTTTIAIFTNEMGDTLTFGDLADFGIELPTYILNGNETKTLNQMQDVVNNLRVATILGYTYDEVNDTVYNGTQVVDGVLGALGKYTISELTDESAINSLTLKDLFGETNDGILSLIDANTTITEIPDALKGVIDNSTIDDLQSNGIITIQNYDNVKDKTFNVDGESVMFSNLTLQQMMTIFVDNIEIIAEVVDNTNN